MRQQRHLIGLLPLLLALLAAGCARRAPAVPGGAASAQAHLSPAPSSSALAVPVSVAPVQRQTLTDTVRMVGALAAERKARVAAQVAGRVVSVSVEEGNTVRPGQLLVALDGGDARMRVAAAEAEVRRARERSLSAQADTEIVSTDTGAAEAHAAEQIHVAQARLEQARSDLRMTDEKTQGDVAVARADLSAARARLRLLQAGTRREEIERARAEVDGAKVSVASAQRDADQAESDWKRKSDLGKQEFIPRQDVENAQRAWEQAKAKVALAQSHLRTLEEALKLLQAGPRSEEVEQAQAQVDAAAERVRSAERTEAILAQKRGEVTATEAQVAQAKKALEAARKGTAKVRKSRQDSEVVRSEVKVAEANLRLARAELEKLRIVAPMSGTITSRAVAPGETVQPGQLLLTVVDRASLYFDGAVSDRDLPKVRIGQEVSVAFDAVRGRTYAGRVREILPAASPQDRSFHVKVGLQGQEGLTQAGMLGTGTSSVARHENVLVLPAAALAGDPPDTGMATVYVVHKGVARERRVAVGARVGDLLILKSGLSEGERVVVDGQAMLKDGRPVQMK